MVDFTFYKTAQIIVTTRIKTQCKGHANEKSKDHIAMPQGVVTFLYTGNTNSVQKHSTSWHSKMISAVL